MELRSSRTYRHIIYPRHLAMYICIKLTGKSNAIIGREFGGRDHSTVHHANTRIIERLKSDAGTRTDFKNLEKIILSLNHCDNETLQKAILDFDVPAIARRALDQPFGRMDVTAEELFAVLSFAAVGDEDVMQFRSEILNPKIIQNITDEEIEIIKIARSVAGAWQAKERCIDAGIPPAAEMSKLDIYGAKLSKAITQLENQNQKEKTHERVS